MSQVDALRAAYFRYLSLPWDRNLPQPQKIWFAIYDPTNERRLRAQLPTFELDTLRAGHGWRTCDITDTFAAWMAAHPYRDSYFESPEDLALPHEDFESFVASKVRSALADSDEESVLGLVGAGALFGLMRVSSLIEQVEAAIRGRLLVFFPGEHEENNYRLLDARDGWNYHAIPITAAGGLLES